jgi:chloramphenicol-sensitive protein RarD
MRPSRKGLIFGFTAYFMWGFFPLFWPLLKPTPALEILSHRVLWSFVSTVALLALRGQLKWIREVSRRQLMLLAIASVFVSINWGLYIWSVNSGRVVETSLGYFINPLVTVLFGVIFLKERLRTMQSFILGCVAISVTIMAIGTGKFPWIALTLATSFATYGFIKKKAQVESLRALSFESGLISIPALGFLIFAATNHTGTFGNQTSSSLLLMFAGVLTALPLLLFGAATNLLPLKTLGPLQYVAPSLQFLLGVFLFHEDMSTARWVGFGLLFVSLIAFVLEGLWRAQPAVT